jgi:hypothetical protein
MLLRSFYAFRLRSAAKRYARCLRPRLIKDYGNSEFYNADQIRAAVRALGLSENFLCLAYAAFTPESAYERSDSFSPYETYSSLRSLFSRYEPLRWASAVHEPAHANFNVMQGGGGSLH